MMGELTKQKLIEKVHAMTPEEQKATAEGLPTEILERELERRRGT